MYPTFENIYDITAWFIFRIQWAYYFQSMRKYDIIKIIILCMNALYEVAPFKTGLKLWCRIYFQIDKSLNTILSFTCCVHLTKLKCHFCCTKCEHHDLLSNVQNYYLPSWPIRRCTENVVSFDNFCKLTFDHDRHIKFKLLLQQLFSFS